MSIKSPKRLYRKLFVIYTVVIIVIVLGISSYFLYVNRNQVLENNLSDVESLSDEAAACLQEYADIADYVQEDLYRSSGELWDVIYYLMEDQQAYLEYRLNAYSTYTDGLVVRPYKGIDDFSYEVMEAFGEILHLEFLSYSKGEVTSYYPSKSNYRSREKTDLEERIQNGNIGREGEVSFVKEIRDPRTLQNVGCMLITFGTEELEAIKQSREAADLVVYNDKGTMIVPFPEDEKAYALTGAEREEELSASMDAYVNKQTVKDYHVLSYIDRAEAGRLPETYFLAAFLASGTAIAVGVLLVRHYLQGLRKRLNYILGGMQRVTTGDLSGRLETEKNGDELDVISENFNEMCRKLELYIEKSYLAELEQKNAELEALQSQINPHFLYNTLEAIRMRAICNGDREVGKMLYSMAVLFRSQLKEAGIITLAQELHYCKKYLELFEFRYQGKFVSSVECEPEYMNIPIIKFVLQPLIENYFVHGMHADRTDNFIKIRVEKEGEDVWILLEDNGKGMTDEEIEKKNRELMENRKGTRKSIGISNVNTRVKVTYGPEYGVSLRKREPEGIYVILHIREKKEDRHEESNAGGR